VRVVQQGVAHRAAQDPAQSAASVAADHDQLRAARLVDEGGCGIAPDDLLQKVDPGKLLTGAGETPHQDRLLVISGLLPFMCGRRVGVDVGPQPGEHRGEPDTTACGFAEGQVDGALGPRRVVHPHDDAACRRSRKCILAEEADHDDGARSVHGHLQRRRAGQQAGEVAPASGPEHHHAGVGGLLQQRVARMAVVQHRAHVQAGDGPFRPCRRVVQQLLARRLVRPAARVHEPEGARAAAGGIHTPGEGGRCEVGPVDSDHHRLCGTGPGHGHLPYDTPHHGERGAARPRDSA
jgi:hypothetical protein